MQREKTEEQRRAEAEASRRWRANHPERAKQVERAAYHRRQALLGKDSRERRKKTAEEKREANRAKVKAWRLRHPQRDKELRLLGYQKHATKRRKESRLWQRNNKERQRATYLMRRYGITPAQYDALGTKCGICGSEQGNKRVNGDGKAYRLFVDHCHDTKRVRGLLCFSCNVGIGYFSHDVTLLEKAINYLKSTA